MIRVGLCGLGSAARHAHLPALRRESERVAVVAACDPEPSRAGLVPEARFHPDVVSLLDGESPDLLVVASPPSAHLEAIAAAAERGVDVLCEKPLGVGPGDPRALASLVERHPGLLLATVLQYRHAPAWGRLATLMDASRPTRTEPFSVEVAVERPGTDPLSAGGWRARGDSEGGILGDHAVHYLALCRDLEPSVRVLGCERTGEPGRETARVDLALDGGTASISVSYAGAARHNRIEARLRSGSLHLCWADFELAGEGLERPATVDRVGALSDRSFVNLLYCDMYAELFDHLGDPDWREAATLETLEVAALLAECLDRAGRRS